MQTENVVFEVMSIRHTTTLRGSVDVKSEIMVGPRTKRVEPPTRNRCKHKKSGVINKSFDLEMSLSQSN